MLSHVRMFKGGRSIYLESYTIRVRSKNLAFKICMIV